MSASRLRWGAALVAVLACVSCATGTSASSDAPAGNGEVELMYFGDPSEAAGYEALVDSYERSDPSAVVRTSPVASKTDLLARLTTRLLSGEPPDVFLLNYREYAQFAAQGVLRDVQGLLDRDRDRDVDVDEADYFPAPLDAFRFDGTELTCLPQNISSLVAYVNVDLLRARGVEVPSAGWTWDDLVTAARRVTDPASGTYGIGTTPDLVRLAPFVWSNGGALTDDDRDPTELTLHTPAAREAVDFFLDLSLRHGVAPPPDEEAALDAEARFLTGRLGLYLNSRRVTPTLNAAADFSWTAVPLPVAPGGRPVTVLHADAYCLARDGDVEAAWRFVRHAASLEGQEVVAASGRIVPSRRDVAASEVFQDSAPEGVADVFLRNAALVRATPVDPRWPQVEEMADSLLAEMFAGRLDREQGLRRLQSESRRLLGGG